jgi:hypothetical protein
MTTIPADAPRSEDGQWWWDGSQWQPVTGDSQGAAEPSEAEVRAVGDSGVEPAQNVPEHLQSAFLEGEPARGGGAEIGAALDDSQFGQAQQEA